MKKYAGWICLCICLALASATVWQGITSRSRAGERLQHLTLQLKSPLAKDSLRQMRELEQSQEQPADFCAWKEEQEQSVAAAETGIHVWANLLWLNGDSQLLLPYGKNLCEEDLQGCLLDRDTAWELFGSQNVEGMTLVIAGQSRVVRGVFSTPKRLVILQGAPAGVLGGWNRVTVQQKPGQSPQELGESFLIRHNLNGNLLRWDFLKGFSWLGELVPGKWSDFAGWSVNLEQKADELRQISQVEKSSLELEYWNLQMRGLGFMLFGVVTSWGVVLLLLKRLSNLVRCRGR